MIAWEHTAGLALIIWAGSFAFVWTCFEIAWHVRDRQDERRVDQDHYDHQRGVTIVNVPHDYESEKDWVSE